MLIRNFQQTIFDCETRCYVILCWLCIVFSFIRATLIQLFVYGNVIIAIFSYGVFDVQCAYNPKWKWGKTMWTCCWKLIHQLLTPSTYIHVFAIALFVHMIFEWYASRAYQQRLQQISAIFRILFINCTRNRQKLNFPAFPLEHSTWFPCEYWSSKVAQLKHSKSSERCHNTRYFDCCKS